MIVKPRWGSNSRGIQLARDAAEAAFFVGYSDEPVIVQRAMGGPEFSIDCLCDLDGRCLNAIPRSMTESRGGESVKGTVLGDPELVELGRAVAEAVGARGPVHGAGLSRSRARPARDGRQHSLRRRLSVAHVRGAPRPDLPRADRPPGPRRDGRAARRASCGPGVTFARYYWQLELDEELRPTGREIVAGGPAAARREPQGGTCERRFAPIPGLSCKNRADAPAFPRSRRSASAPDALSPHCANCGSPLAVGQDWCLDCGTAVRGRLGGGPGIGSSIGVVGLTLLLVLGAVAAAYAALNSDSNKAVKTPRSARPSPESTDPGDA